MQPLPQELLHASALLGITLGSGPCSLQLGCQLLDPVFSFLHHRSCISAFRAKIYARDDQVAFSIQHQGEVDATIMQ